MATTWVLKFPQVDKPTQPILIHVTQKQKSTLDLDLVATDGEEAYKGKLRERHVSKLQSRNFEGTNEEWTELLKYALVSKQGSQASDEQTKTLQIDCTISHRDPQAALTITLRSRIEDITHRLGAIDLAYSENSDDVDLFGWSCQLADQRDKLQEQALAAKQEAGGTQSTIADLQKQLNDLIKAKDDHEEQLLTKFALLLNEKKAKIRNQQRVLATAKVDKKKLNEMQMTLGSEQKNTGSGKRKRDVVANTADDQEDDSEGFEAMDVDKNLTDGEEEQDSRHETPPRSNTPETETASEDESAAPPKAATSSKSKYHNPSPPPPPRTLPFQKKNQKVEANKKPELPRIEQANVVDDEETASEDDEL